MLPAISKYLTLEIVEIDYSSLYLHSFMKACIRSREEASSSF
jgi:hypothetical protein